MSTNSRRTIIVAENIGFCTGIEKAVNEVEKLLKSDNTVYSVDAVLHNEHEMKRLESMGLKLYEEGSSGDVLVLPAHGATLEEAQNLQKNFKIMIDVTCPFVLRSENIVRKLKNEGYKIVIVGEHNHRETKVLRETAGDALLYVIASVSELNEIDGYFGKVAILSQSTISKRLLLQVAEFFLSHALELRFFDTVCPETVKRQEEGKKLASVVDCVIVVGGRHSANTKRLFEIVSSVNKNAYLVEDSTDLKDINISIFRSIAIVSGTSTPKYIIESIVSTLDAMP